MPNNKPVEGRDYSRGSGDVFADLGLNARDRLRAELALQVTRIVKDRRWTQTQAAQALDLDQPKVSHLMHGKISRFTADRLLAMLARLGHDVEVRISSQEHQDGGKIRVTEA